MFGTIRKHQSWLWLIIIGVMILTMIVWTNNSGSNSRRGAGNFGAIDNKPITATEMQQAENDALLNYLVQSSPHQWPDRAGSQFDLTRQAYQQLFIERKLNEYNIHADPDAAAHLASLILGHWDEGQPISMDKFQDILKSKNMKVEDFEHFLDSFVAVRQLESVVGISGKVVTPEEIQSLYTSEYQELAAEAVFFSASNSLPKIPAPTAEALGTFYTNQQANYREPDQMQLSYVYYNVTNFMPDAEKQIGTNLTRQVDEAMTRVGTNFFRLGKTAEEARAKVREILIQQVGESNALTLANSLEQAVIDKKTNILENLNAVAKSKGLEVKVTKPFDKQYGPSEIDLGGNYPVSSFFELNADDPLLPPIRGMDGIYVIAFNQLIPSHIPPLGEIRSRVENDFKFQQALRIAQVNGQSFAQTVTNELAHGKTFAQTCEATRNTAVQVPPFSRGTTRLEPVEDQNIDLNEFKSVAFGTPIGTVSRFIETPVGGFIVHVKQKLPIDEATMKAKLPEFSNLVRERRQSEAFEIWFGTGWSQELNRGLRDIQGLHKQQQ